MPDIEIDKGLAGYLDDDAEVISTSRKEWEPEFRALSGLAEMYRRLTNLIVISDTNQNLPAHLLLVALNQLYGIASELLRRRTRDAHALTRRAIEAAGVAYRLWTHPQLIQVFNEAYPRINDPNDPNQLKPSNRYSQELTPFNSSLLRVLVSKHCGACMRCSALVRHMPASAP